MKTVNVCTAVLRRVKGACPEWVCTAVLRVIKTRFLVEVSQQSPEWGTCSGWVREGRRARLCEAGGYARVELSLDDCLLHKKNVRACKNSFKDHIYVDGRIPGADIQKAVYAFFAHYHSRQGRTQHEGLGLKNKRKQTIVPDLTTANQFGGPVL